MKRLWLVLALIVTFGWGFAAGQFKIFPHGLLSALYDQSRPTKAPIDDFPLVALQGDADAFLTEPADVIMVGDSITSLARWNELFPGVDIANRGVGQDMISGVKLRMSDVLAKKPKRVFLMIGLNDILKGATPDEMMPQYEEIIAGFTHQTKLYVQAILPCSAGRCSPEQRAAISEVNRRLLPLAAKHGAIFLDWTKDFGADGEMRSDLSFDGIHLSGAGFRLWRDLLRPYVEANGSSVLISSISHCRKREILATRALCSG